MEGAGAPRRPSDPGLPFPAVGAGVSGSVPPPVDAAAADRGAADVAPAASVRRVHYATQSGGHTTSSPARAVTAPSTVGGDGIAPRVDDTRTLPDDIDKLNMEAMGFSGPIGFATANCAEAAWLDLSLKVLRAIALGRSPRLVHTSVCCMPLSPAIDLQQRGRRLAATASDGGDVHSGLAS